MTDTAFSYDQRIEMLRQKKLEHTREKQEVIGAMDYDDWPLVLPPEDRRETVRIMGPSGVPITDVRLKGFRVESNHPCGGFFGPEIAGRNFRSLLRVHPTHVDPLSSLGGAYMVNFYSYRQPHWNPDLSYEHLRKAHERYQIIHGIGGAQHFCQDLAIGLEIGFGGILEKIRRCRSANGPESRPFYAGLEHVVGGIQDWISRHVKTAREMAEHEENVQLRGNLLSMAEININILDSARLLEAHEDPSKHPDLVVRVTGFSAYFASLSPEMRQLVIDRVIPGK